VSDGDPAPLKSSTAPNFWPMSIVAKLLDVSRCHLVPCGRPRPRPHCVRWGPSSPLPKEAQQAPSFWPMSAKRSPISATAELFFLTFLVTSKRLQCTTQYTRVLSQPQRQVVTDVCLCSKQLTWFYTTTSTTVAAQSTNINNNSLHSVHCRSVRQAVCTAPRPLSMQTSTDFFLPYDVRQYAI